jgi:hypothetical protein
MSVRMDLQARIEVDGRVVAEGRVIDVQKAVLEVEFPEGNDPALGITERVKLTLVGEDLPRPFTVHPRVVSWSTSSAGSRYELQLGLEEAKPLAILFNPRAAFRVLPTLHPIIEVEVQGIGQAQTVMATLKDISVSGISVLVSIEEERRTLFRSRKVKLGLELPGVDDRLSLIGSTRYRRLVGSMIRYGIEFDSNATPDFTQKQQKVSEYVVRRQIEQIRDCNDTASWR